jgi:hypothetical protein
VDNPVWNNLAIDDRSTAKISEMTSAWPYEREQIRSAKSLLKVEDRLVIVQQQRVVQRSLRR